MAEYNIISTKGKEFTRYSILHSVFEGENLKDFSEENVFSVGDDGTKKYIEQRCKEKWKGLNFSWTERGEYISNERDGKKILVCFDHYPEKIYLDAIIQENSF